MIFAGITALLVKGADKAMTIKDGIKFGIGLELAKLLITFICKVIIKLTDKDYMSQFKLPKD